MAQYLNEDQDGASNSGIHFDDHQDDNDFFKDAESALGITIPAALKKILTACGFENESIIATLTDDNIENIERFARNELHEIIATEDYPKYYGIYCNKPTLFKIPIGHRNVLNLLKNFYLKKQAQKKTEKRVRQSDQSPDQNKKSTKNKRNYSYNSCSSSQENASETRSCISDDPSEDPSEDAKKTQNKILETIQQWARTKTCDEKWNTLKHFFENISASVIADGKRCVISCFCGATYTIAKFVKKNSKCERWIYSNIQSHLVKKHINLDINQSFTSEADCNKKKNNKPISKPTYYFFYVKNAKSKCNTRPSYSFTNSQTNTSD